MKSGLALKLAMLVSVIGSMGCASSPKQPAAATQESVQNMHFQQALRSALSTHS